MPNRAETLQERLAALPWGRLAGGATLTALALLVLAATQWEPLAWRERAATQGVHASQAQWLRGLTELRGVHFAEYRGNALAWELKAALGQVGARRMVFGYIRSHRVLRLVSPRVSIPDPVAPVTLRARLGYYEQEERRWVFVDGELTRDGRRQSFRQMYWYPETRRLERSRTAHLPPVLRFWEPRY